jgi:hypothetical protein
MATITEVRVHGAKLAYVSCCIDGIACDLDLQGVAREATTLARVELSESDRAALAPAIEEARQKQLRFGPVLYTNPRD